MHSYTNSVFSPVDRDHALRRVAGGNETEVYQTDDGQYVVKLKAELGGTIDTALQHANTLREAADAFSACLGPEYTIPSSYLLAEDSDKAVQVLVVQPYLHAALPLFALDYANMSKAERKALSKELRAIMRRSLGFYLRSGRLPDLYGRTSTSHAERKRLNGPHMLPWRMWGFLVERTLLKSHNLMRTSDGKITLVDYDPVRRGPLYRAVYYIVRCFLFLRDYLAIKVLLG